MIINGVILGGFAPIIFVILIVIGIALLINKLFLNKTDEEKEEQINPVSSNSNQNNNNSSINKVVNVKLIGGIIGLIGDSPQNALNRRIKKENANGWKVIQIIPSASGNILLLILRLLILVCTLLLYTPANGYYVIMEKKEE